MTELNTASKDELRRNRRKPDGEIEINEQGSRLVNRAALARILCVTPLTISGWTKLPDGLPFIRPPSADPNRKGLRMLFDVNETLAWVRRHRENPNPTRKGRLSGGKVRHG